MRKRQIRNSKIDDNIEKKYKSLWSDNEFILTLDLYFSTMPSERNHRNKRIVELAKLIQRTPDSISYRLGNYLAVDPEMEKKGFDNGDKKVIAFFNRYKNKKEYLHSLAEQIKATIKSGAISDIDLDLYDEDDFALEGKILLRLHKSRERNRTLIKRKKKAVLNEKNRLACEVCGFDYSKIYGEIGQGFIECHHIEPLANKLNPGKRTTLKDLALVCANCHRMLHRGGNLTIANLQSEIEEQCSLKDRLVNMATHRTPVNLPGPE